MSASGGVMSLDAALNELGMLSSITNSRQDYIAEQLSRLATLDVRENHDVASRNATGEMRTRASSMSKVKRRRCRCRYHPFFRCHAESLDYYSTLRGRSRTMSENESDSLADGSSNQHFRLDPVPYIALPIDSVLAGNLFKSRSMESIDARSGDESVCASDKDLVSETIASSREMDSVSSGLHRLNVSE